VIGDIVFGIIRRMTCQGSLDKTKLRRLVVREVMQALAVKASGTLPLFAEEDDTEGPEAVSQPQPKRGGKPSIKISI
jgi:hypothetical protein